MQKIVMALPASVSICAQKLPIVKNPIQKGPRDTLKFQGMEE
jgi:hypothetical protein